MSSDRVLLVEDDRGLREFLVEELEANGYLVTAMADAESAADSLASQAADLVLSDVRLPGADGFSLLANVQQLDPRPAMVLITAFGTVNQAVEALKAGADDFVTKPLDIDHLMLSLSRALQNRRLRQEVLRYRSLLREETFHGLVGSGPSMQRLCFQLRRVATAEGPVLVTGESGTGKELVARAIHEESPRQQGPYLAVNCGGIPGELMESEFFGHVSGAFTGARGSRPGLFQEASGGTLLLDEIGEMPLALQAKLLRVLQDGKVRPVGADREAQVDVRIIAATNRDLREAVNQGEFREDLFFRLETFTLEVPPLRERGGDLMELASFFLARYAARRQSTIRGFSDACLACLATYPFPGNVRELENAIERAVTFCDAEIIEPRHLPQRIADAQEGEAIPGTVPQPGFGNLLDSPAQEDARAGLISMQELQRRYTHHVLRSTGGNKRQAARILGITRRTLYRWLELP